MPPKRSVSIHAPTRGATYIDIGTDKTITQFQFTHPRGVRLAEMYNPIIHIEFQFTHPRGVRQLRDRILLVGLGFNSRTHAGCDTF